MDRPVVILLRNFILMNLPSFDSIKILVDGNFGRIMRFHILNNLANVN